MWPTFLLLFTAVTAIFATALTVIVRSQLRWEDDEAHKVPEEKRLIKRSNYRVVIGTIVGAYAIFLATAIYFYLLLHDKGLL